MADETQSPREKAAASIAQMVHEWYSGGGPERATTLPPIPQRIIEMRLLRFFPDAPEPAPTVQHLIHQRAMMEAEVEQLKRENVRLQQQNVKAVR